MKRSAFLLLLIFSLFITFFSCSNTPKRSRKPVSTISVQPKKNTYVFGEKISVQVKTKLKNGEIENIKVYYKNQLLKESTALDFVVDGVEINFSVEADVFVQVDNDVILVQSLGDKELLVEVSGAQNNKIENITFHKEAKLKPGDLLECKKE